jgi:predicted lipoprotein with Yx(FWY)xxD motif
MTTRTPFRHLTVASLVLLLAACTTSTGESSAPATTESTPSAAAESMAPSEAASGDATVAVAESDLGQILTDADGNTIYFFANDEEGTSNCEDDCLANWPPVEVDSPTGGDGVSAELGTSERSDGTSQLTVNGYPAYYFAGDQEAGDTNGQGVGGIWWVFGSDGEPIES